MGFIRVVLLIVGVLALAMGLLWIGQGTGYVPWPKTSFMINEMVWAYRGLGLAVGALGVIYVSRRFYGLTWLYRLLYLVVSVAIPIIVIRLT